MKPHDFSKLNRFCGVALLSLCLMAMLTLLAGCNSQSAGEQQFSGKPGVKKVVTTFTILQDMAQAVAGDKAEVVSITKPGAEIHDYDPTPRDIVRAQDADLVLRNGLGLERWFERFLGRLKDVPSVDLSEGITPLGIAEGPYSGKPNPHAWMSPANAVVYVENIRKALVSIDPENEATYTANAAAYIEKVKAVDQSLREAMAWIPEDKRWLVTCEGAFTYLARDYGMKELFLWPVNADEEGTPQQVRRVIDTIREHQIPVCFSESTISDKAMQQVVRETGSTYGGVLYVDSLTDADGAAPTYLKLLEFNVNTIVRGFTKAKP